MPWQTPAVRTKNIDNERHASNFDSIQAAIDDIADNTSFGSNLGVGKVLIPAQDATYSETIDIDEGGMVVEGQGHANTLIAGSGDHTVYIEQEDVTLQHLWADQTGTGSYDAIHVFGDEAHLHDIDIDRSPRHGIMIDGAAEAMLSDIEIIEDIGDTAIVVVGDRANAQNINIRASGGAIKRGILWRSTGGNLTNATIVGTTENSLLLDKGAGLGTVEATIRNSGNKGIWAGFAGTLSYTTIKADITGSTNEAARFEDVDNCTIIITTDGSVTLTSASSNNKVIGQVGGTLTDNGTGNDTSDVV